MNDGLHVEVLPVLDDNYQYLIYEPDDGRGAIVDPAVAGAAIERASALGLELETILVTHHHGDHVGGVAELLAWRPRLQVLCASAERPRVPSATRGLDDGERAVVAGHNVECLLVAGHTRGAAAYYFPQAGVLFSGDTLFLAGCGRLFEGTPAELLASLHKLAALPGETRVYCGHEYTEKNLRFALEVDPENLRVRHRLVQVEHARALGHPTVPGRLDEELATNPFLRCRDAELRREARCEDELALFTDLRRRRDLF